MLDRRTTLRSLGLAGAFAAGALPVTYASAAAPSLKRLRPGDTVGLVAPASSDDEALHLEYALNTIRGMGLTPKVGRHVSDRYGYLSGTDRDRAADLNAMFADDAVRAVFAVRGGWGSGRVLPLLDWAMIQARPKLLIGFSDVTALHLAFAAHAGYPSIHAPNAGNRWDETSWRGFWQLAFAGQTPLLGGPQETPWPATTIRGGKARGRLIGGNLTVLSTLMGTPWVPDFSGAILFLEDVGEAPYRIDRMMNQLALAGVLGKVTGVVFGYCTRCTSDEPNYAGFTVPQILEQYLASLNVPALSGANIGHVNNQLSLPVGAHVEMDADAGTIQLLQPLVR